jgi:hypothetical protein
MNAERWQQVKRLLDTVIALAPSDRTSYLDQACAAGTELRREVDRYCRKIAITLIASFSAVVRPC